jgi:hypothetical protein
VGVTGTFIVSLLLVSGTGCVTGVSDPATRTGGSSTPQCRPDDTATLAQQLTGAAAKLAETPLTFSASLGTLMKVAGAADAPAGRTTGKVILNGDDQISLVVIGTDYYIRYDNPARADAGRWQHLTLPSGTVMKGAIKMGDPRDPMGAARLLKGLVAVETAGDCRFQGTLDLTRAVPAATGTQPDRDPAAIVRFTAIIDKQHRLTSMGYTLPASSGLPALPTTVTFSTFGVPQQITAPPAAEVSDAPESVRQVFTPPS